MKKNELTSMNTLIRKYPWLSQGLRRKMGHRTEMKSNCFVSLPSVAVLLDVFSLSVAFSSVVTGALREFDAFAVVGISDKSYVTIAARMATLVGRWVRIVGVQMHILKKKCQLALSFLFPFCDN